MYNTEKPGLGAAEVEVNTSDIRYTLQIYIAGAMLL